MVQIQQRRRRGVKGGKMRAGKEKTKERKVGRKRGDYKIMHGNNSAFTC